MPFVDLPPMQQERVICAISAAVKYEVPANIVLAVAEKEGGKPGQWVENSNGTHDVGPMQFNTAYLGDLEKYGISPNDVAAAGCYSFDLAAWRLRQHIRNDKGDVWTKSANYHSRTPKYNAIYRADLMRKATKWADWLDARFVTYDMSKPGAAPVQAPAEPVAITQATPEPTAQPARQQPIRSASYVPRQITFSAN
jgi:hypothetical protein